MNSTARGATALTSLNRRGFLLGSAAVAAGTVLSPHVALARAGRKRVLRVAHLTDAHVQPELRAAEGLSACYKHVNGLKEKPDLILFGGDQVMETFAAKRPRTQLQWDLCQKIGKTENGIPWKACIGNHDIWGWYKEKSEASGNEPDYGKKWAVQALELPNRYYSFTQAGWHFIALDSVQPGVKEGTYSAYLDEEQLEWLKKELAGVPKERPILIWSHVPIVSAMVLLSGRKTATSEATITAGQIHTDAGALVDLLAKYPNVKACLSGHLHEVEDLRIKGVNFHCDGAVCGGWWKGPHHGFAEGYALLDLYDDGSYTNTYTTYGWKAEVPAPKE